MFLQLKSNEVLESLVHTHGNISRDFEIATASTLAVLPLGVSRLLRSTQSKIVLTPTVVEYYPWLEDFSPQGWEAGSTWRQVDGVHMVPAREVVIAQGMYEEEGALIESTRWRGVLLHELGHRWDKALGGISRSKRFVNAYVSDVSCWLGGPLENEMEYYLQGTVLSEESLSALGAGLSETCADVFAALHGSAGNINATKRVLRAFPRVANVIRALESKL